jgi:hypothetical protein
MPEVAPPRVAKCGIVGLGLYVGNWGRVKVSIRDWGEMVQRWERGKYLKRGDFYPERRTGNDSDSKVPSESCTYNNYL